MIVVLCENYEAAEAAFDSFIDLLDELGMYNIEYSAEYANIVKTDDDLCYIFIDRRYRSVYEKEETEFVHEIDFFDNLGGYFCTYLEPYVSYFDYILG